LARQFSGTPNYFALTSSQVKLDQLDFSKHQPFWLTLCTIAQPSPDRRAINEEEPIMLSIRIDPTCSSVPTKSAPPVAARLIDVNRSETIKLLPTSNHRHPVRNAHMRLINLRRATSARTPLARLLIQIITSRNRLINVLLTLRHARDRKRERERGAYARSQYRKFSFR